MIQVQIVLLDPPPTGFVAALCINIHSRYALTAAVPVNPPVAGGIRHHVCAASHDRQQAVMVSFHMKMMPWQKRLCKGAAAVAEAMLLLHTRHAIVAARDGT